MLFNSLDFAIFLPIVFAIYWFLKNRKAQNIWIALSSYFFYGWWDWRFLLLIAFSTLVDFSIGLQLEKETRINRRKHWLACSIIANIGLLAFFKYANFFIGNFNAAFTLLGQSFPIRTLSIILPVGISFYTFQTLSYTIDIYRKKINATHDLVSFFAFVSFFPQLVAGPIERAKHLLPQFLQKRRFNSANAIIGLRQILWGLVKKVVIADNCARYVDYIFQESAHMNSSALVLGAFFFAIQIYGDFSGYTDIAIGTARLFGFQLMQNFAFPYFSRDIAEFWRKWHISLTTWFRDYLYFPLGGSYGSKTKTLRNVIIVFLVSGFWHGANWTFIAWGAVNALLFIPLLLFNSNRKHLNSVAEHRFLPSVKELMAMISTFTVTTFAWIFFRADSIEQALLYIKNSFTLSIFHRPNYTDFKDSVYLLFLIVLFMLIEWVGRRQTFAIEYFSPKIRKPIRYAFYIILIYAVLWNMGQEQRFIYFQF